MCVILVGNQLGQFQVIGPFEGFEEAVKWQANNPLGLEWSMSWILPLESPLAVAATLKR